ncbi:MAG: isoaspartyl peptidase/L-asparaginase [candidate division WOR-3 bacterium]
MIEEILLLVHGGASKKLRDSSLREKVLGEALEAGFVVLKEGGEAALAVVKAIMVIEDSSAFNAGSGSVPNLYGEAEMDASVATSEGKFGAVISIKNVKNPVRVAYEVMDKTEHLILAGEGALQFARSRGFKEYNPLSDEMKKLFKEKNQCDEKEIEKLKSLYSNETVGAIAKDSFGNIAAALSTGGPIFHLPGRVSDVPILGGGIYASPRGATTITGPGEVIIKEMIAKKVDDYLAEHSAEEAAMDLIQEFDIDFGIAIVDQDGKVGIAYNTESMSWGIKTSTYKEVQV